MSYFLISYLSIGFGIWLGLAIAFMGSMKDASAIEIARGILGIFVWPFILFFIEQAHPTTEETKEH